MRRVIKRAYCKTGIITLLISFTVIFSLCRHSKTLSKVVARVNYAELTIDMIQASIPNEFRDHVKSVHIKEYVDRWVDNQILYQEAIRRGVQKEKAVMQEIEQMKQQVILNYLLEQELQKSVTVTEADINDYYEKNKEQFIRPEDLVHFFQIMSDSTEKLSRIRSKILRGERLEDLARKYSSHPSSKNGGDMGWVRRSQLLPQIETQAFRLKTGNLSYVIKTDLGYHIIKVMEIRPKDEIQTLDEVEQIIRERVKSRKRAEKYGHLLAILKDAAQIEVNLNYADELVMKTANK